VSSETWELRDSGWSLFNFHLINIPGSRATRRASRTAVHGRIQTFPVSAPPERSRIGIAVATALAGVGTPLAPPVLAADVSAGALQEVVVTARKREENLQDVPISIAVMTKEDLQNLGIAKFEDYVTKVPSLSFISVGPGLQTLYIRGVSDGSKPNVSNTSATGYFLDDSSLGWYGAQPDLHLYDIERIEVLNGPQGTTFGAGSMAGAVRFITVKPDFNAFSMGVDFDGAQIQDGRQNWTYEGFLNAPLIQGRLGLRLSGFALSKGGFIDNLLTTRTWKNGAISNNAKWARNDYNREHQDGGRIALRGILNDHWSGDLSFTYQRQSFDGAWDQDLVNYGEREVSRFGPESRSAEAKILNFHVDGDVDIGDLVFASTYWSLPTRQNNEYSEYMENVSDPTYNLPAGYLEALACDTGPTKTNPTQSYTGCNVPIQYYEYHANPERWSNELRLAPSAGTPLARRVCTGKRPATRTPAYLLHSGTQVRGRGLPVLRRVAVPAARRGLAARSA
jgi:outer membrane receptor protein involved in Fe transport